MSQARLTDDSAALLRGLGMEKQFITGIAHCLWSMAWADWADQTGAEHTGQCEITDIMPDIPQQAIIQAINIAGLICGANAGPGDDYIYRGVSELVQKAADADKVDSEEIDHQEFGFDLCMQVLGSGVSWFDNHERFDLKLPYMENPLDCQFDMDDLLVSAGVDIEDYSRCVVCNLIGVSEAEKCPAAENHDYYLEEANAAN